MRKEVVTDTPIPYARQSISVQDIEAVIQVLRSDWLTQGPAVERFEKAVAEYCGARYAVAVNSGTSALHIACLAAGLGPGDILWTSPNTFVASSNCAVYCGATPDFVDIDPRTMNLDATELEEKLERGKSSGRLPKVVVPVHFTGQPCEMERISRLGRAYGFSVLEDASHAIGAWYGGTKVGSCSHSEMTVFSFHPVKIITTGEGGMVVTNRQDLHERLVRLRSHGITRDPGAMDGESHGPWYYQQVELGFNYRMTDIQAALGLSQLTRIDEFVARRHELVARYNQALSDLRLILPYQHPDTYSAFHLYVIRLQLDRIQKTHRQIFEDLRARGILVNLHYIPVHTQPYYQRLGFRHGDFPTAERYYREALSIPLYAGLTDEDQNRVITALREVVR
jgi:UDP-4-amino-4,6-dideoxy-N-acetyl-beta-L-altrosamine transaminase